MVPAALTLSVPPETVVMAVSVPVTFTVAVPLTSATVLLAPDKSVVPPVKSPPAIVPALRMVPPLLVTVLAML